MSIEIKEFVVIKTTGGRAEIVSVCWISEDTGLHTFYAGGRTHLHKDAKDARDAAAKYGRVVDAAEIVRLLDMKWRHENEELLP